MDALEEIRIRLRHEWNCPDIYSKWEGYFIDELLYSNTPLEDILEECLQDLKEEIDRDAGIN